MATTLKKPEPESSKPKTPKADTQGSGTAVEIEVAGEIMMGYVGHLNTEIMKEEAQPKPNQEKIDALQCALQTVFNERKELYTDRKLVLKAMYVYGPIMKAFIKTA